MKKFIKPFLLVIFYFLSMMVSLFLILTLLFIFDYDSFVFASGDDDVGQNYVEMLSPYIGVSIIINTLLTIAIAYLMKMVDFRHSFDCKSIDWKNIWIPIAGSVCFIFVVYVSVHILQFSSYRSDAMFRMFENVYGAIALIFLSPVLEELIFRDIIIRYMFSKGATPLQALICSVLCYALVAIGDPWDVPIYFCHAILFGILFIKTGSVILATIIRISIYLFQYVVLREFDLLNINTDMPTSYYVVLFFVFTPPAIFLLWKFWQTPLPDGRHLPFDDAKIEVVE